MTMMRSIRRMYRDSVKSDLSDELINTYVQRPAAGLVTYALAFTPVTPNQVTLCSTLFGIACGGLLALDPPMLWQAGACAYLKDIFDSADGQLARATHRYSRRGRFWDSIGDFIVNCAVYAGIFLLLIHAGTHVLAAAAIAAAGWLGVNLRVSYQVFYQTNYLHVHGAYATNRVMEDVRPADEADGDRLAVLLQRIFMALYGWQDRLIARIDSRCRERARDRRDHEWYTERTALRFTSLFGMGTEYTALAVCLAAGSVGAYLVFTLAVSNVLWAAAVAYRFFFALRSSASISK